MYSFNLFDRCVGKSCPRQLWFWWSSQTHIEIRLVSSAKRRQLSYFRQFLSPFAHFEESIWSMQTPISRIKLLKILFAFSFTFIAYISSNCLQHNIAVSSLASNALLQLDIFTLQLPPPQDKLNFTTPHPTPRPRLTSASNTHPGLYHVASQLPPLPHPTSRSLFFLPPWRPLSLEFGVKLIKASQLFGN